MATAYKHTNLVLKDQVRMARILMEKERPAQLVMAANAHPADTPGKRYGKTDSNLRLASRDSR